MGPGTHEGLVTEIYSLLSKKTSFMFANVTQTLGTMRWAVKEIPDSTWCDHVADRLL